MKRFYEIVFPISEENLGAWWNVGTARTMTTTFTTPPSSSSATNVKTDGTWNAKSKSWTSWKIPNCSTSLTRSTTEGTNSVLSLNSKKLMFILGKNFYSDFGHEIRVFNINHLLFVYNLKDFSKFIKLKIILFIPSDFQKENLEMDKFFFWY